jgi:hypothetical protein
VARRARSESEPASRELTAAAARWSITRDGLAAAIDPLCEDGVKAALRASTSMIGLAVLGC